MRGKLIVVVLLVVFAAGAVGGLLTAPAQAIPEIDKDWVCFCFGPGQFCCMDTRTAQFFCVANPWCY